VGLAKRDYTDNVTVITAENLNDIQDSIIVLETTPSQGLSEEVKQALLQLAQKVAYIDDQGQTYYDDLYNALYPPANLVSITAVYTQSGTVYPTTPLNDLKADLVVTGTYDDQTTATIPTSDYSLSGTLTVGTSTITVTSGGKTTTFSVTVTAAPTLSSISAVYTQSGTVYDTDTLDSLKDDLVVTANYSDSSTQTVPAADYTLSGTLTVGTSTITVSYGGMTDTFNVTVTHGVSAVYDWDFTQGLVDSVSGMTAQIKGGATQDSSGVHFSANNQCVILTDAKVPIRNRTIIIDIPSAEMEASTTNHMRLFSSASSSGGNAASSAATFCYRTGNGWTVYSGSSWGTSISKTTYPANFFSNKRVKLYFGEDLKLKLSYASMGSDSFTDITTFAAAFSESYASGYLVIGSYNTNTLQPITFSGVEIYEGEV
jgi:hypothetical protein